MVMQEHSLLTKLLPEEVYVKELKDVIKDVR